MATTHAVGPITLHKCASGYVEAKEVAAGEEASMTYKKGAPLVLDGTSKEGEEWAGSTDASLLIGFSVAAATGTTGAKQQYWEANDDNEFEATLINDTAAVALAQSHIGTSYSLIKDSTTGYWFVDVNDVTTTMVRVIDYVRPKCAIGDSNARVIVRVLQAKQANVA